MKVIGGQTKTDISSGQNVPHFMGENDNSGIKKKNKKNNLYIYI